MVFIWGVPEQYGNYRRAVAAAGGRTRISRDLSETGGCDALLLPGGGDLEPRRYGQAATARRALEPERDEAELLLLERFTAAGRPVLGICRGMQVLNVFFGGTLLQDLPGHSQAAGRDRLHRVRTAWWRRRSMRRCRRGASSGIRSGCRGLLHCPARQRALR